MVYYYLSNNVKMLRNILIDYAASKEICPYEYIKSYIEKCPESTEDSKLSWITESFLGIQKHGLFLKEIILYMSNEITEEEHDYLMIILHAIIFQIDTKDANTFYKCLFNLSKPLLDKFTKFLSNSEVLPFISQIAHNIYDTNYVTKKIIKPLFTWQPYISEMTHTYAEYVKKLKSRKTKPPTIPVQPNVLNRIGKTQILSLGLTSLPATPPNSLKIINRKKMLPKSIIDQRLKQLHEENQQKAFSLLQDVKNKKNHYTQEKSDRYYKRISRIRDEIEDEITKSCLKPKKDIKLSNPYPIKETVATIKRMSNKIQLAEEEEVKWLQTLMTTCRNVTKIEELEEKDRQQRERERLLDIERKHLMGQISYEDALIAKKKLRDENKKKYEEFLIEKNVWKQQIEKWKKVEMEKNHKQVEKLSMIELNLLKVKNSTLAKKKEIATKLKKESEIILEKAMKDKQEELEQRINMIKEIRILAMIAKKARMPKFVDLTETSGLGLLCEMSMTELQERLCAFKIGLQEELERKKKIIQEEKNATKRELEDNKNDIKAFRNQRSISRKQNKTSKIYLESPFPKEINDLRKILEEKRKLNKAI